jgi:hypothetical protein
MASVKTLLRKNRGANTMDKERQPAKKEYVVPSGVRHKVLRCISKEASEATIAQYGKCRILAIDAVSKSVVAGGDDILDVLNRAREACPNGQLFPTSTARLLTLLSTSSRS